MYSWNDIKISVEGDNTLFIDGIKKYLNAVYVHDYEGNYDIKTTITMDVKNGTPVIPADADNPKSIVYSIGSDIRLDVYIKETQSWYIYRDTAAIWFDYSTNELVLAIDSMPMDFEYRNILTFFLHPLGTILENLGYYRLNCSCGSIDNKAILFAGTHGSGRTTSAFNVPTHGGNIVSEELTYIYKDDTGYHPSSLTKLVGVGLETVNSYFPELSRVHSAAFSNNTIYYFLDDINSTRQEDMTIAAIAHLEKSNKRTTGCSPASSSEIMPMLFPDGIHTNIEAVTGPKFLFIADLLDQITNCKLTCGTDMMDFADHLNELLKT